MAEKGHSRPWLSLVRSPRRHFAAIHGSYSDSDRLPPGGEKSAPNHRTQL